MRRVPHLGSPTLDVLSPGAKELSAGLEHKLFRLEKKKAFQRISMHVLDISLMFNAFLASSLLFSHAFTQTSEGLLDSELSRTEQPHNAERSLLLPVIYFFLHHSSDINRRTPKK